MSPRTGRPMETQSNATYLDFPMLGRPEIVADFDGGALTSDGGALLLRTTEQLTGVIRQFAACFADHRKTDRIEHTVEELVAQRGDFLSEGGQARTVLAVDAEAVGDAEVLLMQRLASASRAALAAQSVRAVHWSWHRQ